MKKIIPDGPSPENSTLTYKKSGITVIGPAKNNKNIKDGLEKEKSLKLLIKIR